MSVDVLVCVHSQDDYHDDLLWRALRSLEKQTCQDFSVVCVLDECHEGTSGVVREFSPVKGLYIRPQKKGLADAKNFGIARCDAEWIAYLDADDAWHPEKLERQLSFLSENPDYSTIGTQAWDVYNPGGPNERIEENCFSIGQYRTNEQIRARLPIENVICHGSVLISKSAIASVGGYSTSPWNKGLEDWHLWRCLASLEYQFYNIPERLYMYSMGTSVPR
jgi:glycosyltransferase involved in cell wall biosynthesis